MVVNISYLKADRDLTNAMWLTAEPNYMNTDIEWLSLADFISDSSKQYSPYYFHCMTKVKENWDNDRQNLLIFDIDDGMTINEASNMFSKYTNLIITTKSHRKEKKGTVCDRFRIILPATNIPRGEMYFCMLEAMSMTLPMDVQVNNKTGAFLGFTDSKYRYNKGVVYDCTEATKVSTRLFINRNKKNGSKGNIEGLNNDLDLTEVKELIDFELTVDILDSLGYEVRGNKVKLREERTPSTKIYENGTLYDFGDGKYYDLFSLLYERHNMKFNEAIDFIRRINGHK